ncbi:uncharacterized protein LOC124357621 [Homalodisca vitripennis]|uniref:uncharacterized protein LOC124357621 n=1 Tax=Homalodisca vitripennis TaxID=197043 RepID=UPI001EEC2500|nr:uncharacterized protein LOC124357621 [Homalodisca vitripennis]XP_046665525.1 uncharacterized protein LOC124357621 [Homalodisca vitripennis]
MSIPQLDSCCCGCSLKTGSKIIGWISMIANIVSVITFGLALAGLYYIQEHPDKVAPENKAILDNLPTLKAVAIMMIITHIIGCILSLILLMGVYQQKAKLVLTWVLIALTCALIEQLVNLIQLFTVYQAANIGNIIWFLLDLYFILVVYSFYREIQNVGNYA